MMRAPKSVPIRQEDLGYKARLERVRGAELRKQAQTNLFRFLMTDLQIAEAFCELAESTRDQRRKQRLLRSAREAMDAIRSFNRRLLDEDLRRKVRAGVSKLSERLKAMPCPRVV